MATTLIIADDEPLVLVGLQSMLNWRDLGFEIVAVARNGKQLEEAIEATNPDLVITDIKMPIKSGLEVLKQTNQKRGRLPLFILLTSYEEFSLVKEALKNQAVDYLVKLELTEESLKASVTKAVQMIADIRGSEQGAALVSERSAMQPFQDKFFVRLFNGLIEDKLSFGKQMEELKLDLHSHSLCVCYCEIIPAKEQEVSLYNSTTRMLKETLNRYIPCYLTSLDLHHLAITFKLEAKLAAHYRTVIHKILEKTLQVIYNYFTVHMTCAVGIAVEDPFLLSESFQSARQLLASSSGESSILIAEKQDSHATTFSLDPFKAKLTHSFEELDGDKLKEVIEEVAQHLESHAYSSLQAIDTASTILYMAITLLIDGQMMVENVFSNEPRNYRQIYQYTTTEQCTQWLRQLSSGLREQLQTRKQDYRAKVVTNIQQYIKENISRKLQLGEVAMLFGFSQNYLSSIFSKYSGCSFVEYTTNAKIAAAKEMMGSGDHKMYEIAEKLGFESSFYFSKVFKKVEGRSPRQYLQHLQRTR